MKKQNPVFCAIDVPNIDSAVNICSEIKEFVGGFKLGLELFMATGAKGYREIAKIGLPIFLDVKLHDIPNTVKGALNSLLPLEPSFITIHTSGGETMMRTAAETAAKAGKGKTKLLGVTVMTSLDSSDMEKVGQDTEIKRQVLRLAQLAKNSGLDGVVCSPEEISFLREQLGHDFILMVPGIRPEWTSANDQKRVMTPREAIKAGATYIVIGRPITSAESPMEAAKKIYEEISE